ncbi:MAG: hypothetical protein A2Y62_10890 [Candidatus Fischerbacteria bacterium RBG_13_37_8]|uniref:HEAT repeat domain-containing protein n=1 Tax=Candidatus Fischerbacteria bacterium RBG_13_37_8 TaxID=1817863 RepID=A0A1F5VUG0_9BACT|nr:MAG: hypothetical protein A2Y62_10890 [Candidatus Fischerbacteria bacterium RBG_13_37_8]
MKGKICFILIFSLLMAFSLFAQQKEPDPLITNLKNGNEKQKQIAAKELGKRQDESAVPVLREALGDENHKVRKAVIEALMQIPGKESIRALCLATEDEVPGNRELAIEGLVKKYLPEPTSRLKKIFGTIQDLFSLKEEENMVEPWVKVEPEIEKALIKRLNDQKSVSLLAISAIHSLRIKGAIPDLIKSLKGDEERIIEILKTLADFKAHSAGENIIPLLLSKRDKIVAYASYCLGKIKYEPAIQSLIQLYNYSADTKYQKYALAGLSLLAATDAVKFFQKNLRSDDSEFRILSAEAFARIADTKYTEEIARAFLNEKDEKVKLAIDFALFKLKRKEHMMNIIKAINVQYDIVESYIIESGEDGFMEIARYIPNLEDRVKIKIIKIMGHSYNPAAIKYLEPYLNDADINIATASFEAIKRLKKIEEMNLMKSGK